MKQWCVRWKELRKTTDSKIDLKKQKEIIKNNPDGVCSELKT